MTAFDPDAVARGEVDTASAKPVSLECRDALDVIRDYGRHDDVLLYVDPPYLRSSRNSAGYRHEMGRQDQHEALAAALHGCTAAVVLSGYASPLYQDLYASWDVTELAAWTGNGATGLGKRTEVLWSNRPFPVEWSLFDTSRSGESGASS